VIFVTIGTSEPFDRLLRALDALPGTEEVIVQRGASGIDLTAARSFDFLAYDEFVAHIRAARVVVAHAGAGSVMTCLACGKRPVVVPRLRRFGETSDDHQLAFGRRLAEAGLATLVEDPERLPEALANGAGGTASAVNGSGGLVRELRAYLTAVVGT
jgi:UDP-N-acetylglucosamine transferase subunit ALG13